MTADPSETLAGKLRSEHTPRAVAARIGADSRQSYLRDFVYGSIDGCVTTFAIVAGVVGAELEATVVLILGFANLIADGFSMAASNYLGTRAELQARDQARRVEEVHIEQIPEGEREEIRAIFRQKGFEGDLLEQIVSVITGDRTLWIETMLREEWGLSLARISPGRAALATFVAFVCVGVIPLLPFMVLPAFEAGRNTQFAASTGMTALAFFGVGTLKSYFVASNWARAGLETLLIGGAAAALAYCVGVLLS